MLIRCDHLYTGLDPVRTWTRYGPGPRTDPDPVWIWIDFRDALYSVAVSARCRMRRVKPVLSGSVLKVKSHFMKNNEPRYLDNQGGVVACDVRTRRTRYRAPTHDITHWTRHTLRTKRSLGKPREVLLPRAFASA